MALTAPPLELLPQQSAVIGEPTGLSRAAATHEHVYAATGELTRAVPLARATDVDTAVAVARRALPQWRAMRLRR